MGSTVDFFTWQLFQHVNLLWQICTHSYCYKLMFYMKWIIYHELGKQKKKVKNDQGSCKYKLFMQIFCGETWKKLGLWQDLKQWCQCYALTELRNHHIRSKSIVHYCWLKNIPIKATPLCLWFTSYMYIICFIIISFTVIIILYSIIIIIILLVFTTHQLVDYRWPPSNASALHNPQTSEVFLSL